MRCLRALVTLAFLIQTKAHWQGQRVTSAWPRELRQRPRFVILPSWLDDFLGSFVLRMSTAAYDDAATSSNDEVPPEALHNFVILREIGQNIAKTAEREFGTSFNWEWHLVMDPVVSNAFCTPGGRIVVTSALINQLVRDEERGACRSASDVLAFILSHEISHAIVRHSVEALSVATVAFAGVVVAKLFISIFGGRLGGLMTLCDLSSSTAATTASKSESNTSESDASAEEKNTVSATAVAVARGTAVAGAESSCGISHGDIGKKDAPQRSQPADCRRPWQKLAAAAAENRPPKPLVPTGQLLASLGFLAGSRANEREADRMAIFLMSRSGFDPSAALDFFQRKKRLRAVQAHARKSTGTRWRALRPARRLLVGVLRCVAQPFAWIDNLCSTHPPRDRRAALITEFMEQHPELKGARLAPRVYRLAWRAASPKPAALQRIPVSGRQFFMAILRLVRNLA
ncbi:unnamed protein product [Phaeothamnion confervicola]